MPDKPSALKISFKKGEKQTGLSSVGNPYPDTDIKLDGLKVGYIDAPTWQTKDGLWCVRVMRVKERTEAEPAPFIWVTFKRRFEFEPEARTFIKEGALEKLDFELYRIPKE